MVATATASVTLNSDGSGFVGKGDVQAAFGWTNAKLQQNAGGVTFSTAQAVSQDFTQALTQTATQAMSETVSCTITVGGEKHPVTFYRDGTRAGTQTGTETGSRTGTKTGTINGTVAFDPRLKNQITGFNLTGFGSVSGPAWDSTVWDSPTWSDDWTWGETVWGAFTGSADVNSCLGGDPNVSDLVDTVTPGDVTPGDIGYGDITPGTITYGATTLYVNYPGYSSVSLGSF